MYDFITKYQYYILGGILGSLVASLLVTFVTLPATVFMGLYVWKVLRDLKNDG